MSGITSIKTDHSEIIETFRSLGTFNADMAADLLEMHDRQSLSLDNWDVAIAFVNAQFVMLTGDKFVLQKNGA